MHIHEPTIALSNSNNNNNNEEDFSEERSILIFGYGSLIWNPGFAYTDKRKAHATGFARRMYQGNTYHRGDESLPGRVATLIEDVSERANGVVFLVQGKRNIVAALEHLEERELGNGYEFVRVPVEVVDGQSLTYTTALTCIARRDNQFYLGPDAIEKMADEIRSARGCAGPNCDYVLKLAEHVRRLFPEAKDDHLFGLEQRIRSASV